MTEIPVINGYGEPSGLSIGQNNKLLEEVVARDMRTDRAATAFVGDRVEIVEAIDECGIPLGLYGAYVADTSLFLRVVSEGSAA